MPLGLTERAKADLLAALQAALGGQSPGDRLRKSVENLILDLAFSERRELGEMVRDALKDDRVSREELSGLLALWVDRWPPSRFFANDFVKGLVKRLQDGVPSPDDIADLVGEWLANRLPGGGTLHQLILAAALGHLDEDSVVNALLTYLKRIGEQDIADALLALMHSNAPVTLPGLLQLVVAVLVREGRVPQPSITDKARSQAVVNALGLLGADSQLREILEAIGDKQYARAAALALAAVGVTADEGLLNAVLTGGNVPAELRRIVIEKLTPLVAARIEGATHEQAGQVAELLLDIVAGKKPLVASQTEQNDLQMTNRQYALFQKVRRAIYGALLATRGGARIPDVAQAQPHVFAAAAITGDTKLRDLVAQDQRRQFVAFVHNFAIVEVGRTFSEPVTVGTLTAGADVMSVFDSILIAHPDLA